MERREATCKSLKDSRIYHHHHLEKESLAQTGLELAKLLRMTLY